MRGFLSSQILLVFLLCSLTGERAYARPTKEEKAQRRASYWGLFADVYRARSCLDSSPGDSGCVTRALQDAASHVAGVDAVVDADDKGFSNEIISIQGLLSGGNISVASERLETLRDKLITDFASNTAPVVQPSRELGVRVYNEYCSSCHGDGMGADGPLAKKLRVKPAAFSMPGRKTSQSPFGIYGVMIHGVDKSEMSSMLDVLSVDELWAVAFYVSSLPYNLSEVADVAGISARITPIAKQFALSTLAISTDEELTKRLARLEVACGSCQNEVAFLRAVWPWSGNTGRLGEVAASPRQRTETRALVLLLFAIIAVSGGFYVVLRRTGRVE